MLGSFTTADGFDDGGRGRWPQLHFTEADTGKLRYDAQQMGNGNDLYV